MSLGKHMKLFFPFTTQDKKVMEYLNMRVIHTDVGISIDQTHHIKSTILDAWFLPDTTEQPKTAETLYRTDSEFEHQSETQLPATGNEFFALENDYKGKCNKLLG